MVSICSPHSQPPTPPPPFRISIKTTVQNKNHFDVLFHHFPHLFSFPARRPPLRLITNFPPNEARDTVRIEISKTCISIVQSTLSNRIVFPYFCSMVFFFFRLKTFHSVGCKPSLVATLVSQSQPAPLL